MPENVISTLRDEIRLVVANLERRPWIQEELQNGDAVCAHGAVTTCEGLRPGDEHIIRAVMRAKGVDEGWNDEDGRTKAEVVERMAHLIGVSDADLADTFGPNWRQVIALIRRAATLSAEEARLLAAAGDAAWADARVAARDAAWFAAWVDARIDARDAAWDAAWDAARDAAWVDAWVDARDAARDAAAAAVIADLVGQHRLEQHHIDTLMKPWIDTLGPNWAEGMVDKDA